MQQRDNEPAPWQWRDLPDMSDERYGAGGCVLSDGRFAVFGGTDNDGGDLASCRLTPGSPQVDPRLIPC